jgi:hypothetical protein
MRRCAFPLSQALGYRDPDGMIVSVINLALIDNALFGGLVHNSPSGIVLHGKQLYRAGSQPGL